MAKPVSVFVLMPVMLLVNMIVLTGVCFGEIDSSVPKSFCSETKKQETSRKWENINICNNGASLREKGIATSTRNENSSILCISNERQALLHFKRDIVDPSNRLFTWDSKEEECCKWAGIICDNTTGHVKELRLASPLGVAGGNATLSGKISPSLLELRYLSHLDLSHNDFKGIQIPSFMGSLVSLRYLNLTEAGFAGKIPYQLGNLSSLIHLGLQAQYDPFYDHQLYSENLDWLSGLSSLQYLDMNNVDLSEASNWLVSVNKLPYLLELHLYSCTLSHIHPLSHVNFTYLEILDISSNSFNSLMPDWIFSLNRLIHLDLQLSGFEGPFPSSSWSLPSLKSFDVSFSNINSSLPSWFFRLNNLVYLNLHNNAIEGSIPCGLGNMTLLKYADLSENDFNSTIPDCLYGFSSLEQLDLHANELQGDISNFIQNMTSIVSLDLSDNALQGKIPQSMGNLCSLETISLEGNKYRGEITEAFQSLLRCKPNKLRFLNLGGNSYYGQMSDNIREFKNLVGLSLRGNMLSGSIPASLGELSELEDLNIDGNQLNGSLPESLGSLSKLQRLDISNNLLEGVVTEVHFANLTNLSELYASGNSLTLRVKPEWIPPFRLTDIALRSWKLGPRFPIWLRQQKHFSGMDLSDTAISDVIPNWFWNLSTSFSYLNLSHNQIRGEIPDLKLVAQFSIIYLSSNKFGGSLPRISANVRELDLSNNSFSGDIANFLCHPIGEANRLKILHLGRNPLSGNIPDCWMYWPELELVKLNNDNLTGEIPSSMGSLRYLLSLHLRNNSLSGEIPQSLHNCTYIMVIDFGLNEFTGSIPTWIGLDLSNLIILGLRSNKFSGKIPTELCHLTQLRILDIANNNLSGSIPRCFNNLTAMATKPSSSEPIFYSSYHDEFLENAFIVTRGREDQYNTILTLVISLDLSNNNLSGEFPDQLTSLYALFSLNLSGNHFRGSISDKIGNLTWAQSLDFSRNQLSGKIPPSIANLNFLSYFNVSYNNLSGEIPQSNQLQRLDASNFIGNRLCGPPLSEDCRPVHNTTLSVKNTEEEERDEYHDWFCLGIAVGFVVGFLGVIIPILLYGPWRRAYFWFFQEYVWYKILDCFIKFKHMMGISTPTHLA